MDSDQETVEKLVAQHGLEIFCRIMHYSSGQWTPLHYATGCGQIRVVQYLVGQCRADVGTLDGRGRTLLHWAAGTGQLGMVKYLLLRAKIEAKDNTGMTPLHLAAAGGQLEVVRYLAEERKANVGQGWHQRDTSALRCC